MTTKELIYSQLKQMGLKHTDTVMIHSSLKAINLSADELIESLTSYFNKGLVILPTHSWKQMSETYNMFNSQTEPSCTGVLSEIFRKHPKAIRSLHPTHSVAAIGHRAKEFLKNEENANTPTPYEGVYGKLSDINTYILLVGVTSIRNTFIHAIEEKFDIPNRLTPSPIKFRIYNPINNEIIEREFYKHYTPDYPHLSENFLKIEQQLINLNIIKKTKFGHASTLIMNAKELDCQISKWLKQDPTLFSDNKPFSYHIKD